mmetsp:Transcript_13339/g.41831  ORF Transcript_13339/g.41831 Transcript_13339/m.41831 type:complete len:96 (+) Transcript_13339:2-289(+)
MAGIELTSTIAVLVYNRFRLYRWCALLVALLCCCRYGRRALRYARDMAEEALLGRVVDANDMEPLLELSTESAGRHSPLAASPDWRPGDRTRFEI